MTASSRRGLARFPPRTKDHGQPDDRARREVSHTETGSSANRLTEACPSSPHRHLSRWEPFLQVTKPDPTILASGGQPLF